MNKTIHYHVREVYGKRLEYVKNPADALLIQQLTGKKTIDYSVRGLLQKITEGRLEFEQVLN